MTITRAVALTFACGASAKVAAELFGISAGTVSAHVRDEARRLGLTPWSGDRRARMQAAYYRLFNS